MRKLLAIASIAAVATSARAQDPVKRSEFTLERKNDRKSVRVTGALEYVSISSTITDSSSGTSTTGAELKVSGPAVGVGFLYGLTDKLGFTGQVRQAFAQQTGFSSMFSELAVGLSYAITGSFFRDAEEVVLGSQTVSKSLEYDRGGFRATLVANQYFLNASNNVIGLSGLGLGFTWDAPTKGIWTWHLGLRGNIASNGSVLIYPIQILAGISYWL